MFDDQSLNKSGQIPSNLPVGEPEDIFAGNESSESELKPVSVTADNTEEPEVGASNTALDAGVLKSKESFAASTNYDASKVSGGITDMPVDLPSADFGAVPIKKPSIFKSILIIIIIVLGLSAVGTGAWWLYQNANLYFKKPATLNVPTNTSANTDTATIQSDNLPTSAAALPSDTAVTVKPNTSSANFADDAILFGDTKDTDNDGLDDDKENALGIDPKNWDTDGDGLSDGDEANVWHTNPKNPDTDGDGYKDGDEVKNGYNPNGPGKIFTPPGSATSTPNK